MQCEELVENILQKFQEIPEIRKRVYFESLTLFTKSLCFWFQLVRM